MMRSVGLWVYLLGSYIPLFSQVDTTLIYNTSMPYGTLDLRIAKSETRYYYLQEDTTFSYREVSPGVKSTTYRDMTSWNSAPYRQGNLRERNGNNDYFIMNYRFLMPENYNASYEPGYPIIIMLHGYGERGNCWFNNCYWDTPGWNPNTNSPPAPTIANHSLLNNDHNLLHGGLKHLDAVKLAGNKLPNDPNLPERAFPGFVLFPQSLNGWQQSARVEEAIKLLRLIMKKYNVDPNRVYIHALSNGGGGLYQAIKRAPWLFSAALPMSAVTNSGATIPGVVEEVAKIPMWVFQGGKDQNPTPNNTYNTIKAIREAGGVVRYSLYPHLGHGTWNTAYNEPDFFSWMLDQQKINPHVKYGNPVICNTTGTGVTISFPKGFYAYQWQYDGQILTGETSYQYIANTPGTVRGRFSRIPNPTEADWEPWSAPIVVTEIEPAKPTIEPISSTHLRGPGLPSTNENNEITLKSKEKADLYSWYRNGTLLDVSSSDIDDTLRTISVRSHNTNMNGAYTLRTSYSYCPSPHSDPINVYFDNSATQTITINSETVDFKGALIEDGVFLTWNDVVSNELGYEIWRRKSGTQYFTFAGRAGKDALSFYDTPLEPETTYEYKLRAVNNSGVSNYIPADDLNINYQITTGGDNKNPAAPQNLKMVSNTITSVTLSWDAAADNTGVKSYIIRYGGNTVSTDTSLTTHTITGLASSIEFPVTVQAIDHAGNASPESNQVMASTYVLGLFYKHSTGGWEDLDEPSMIQTWADPEFTGTVDNFTLSPRTQEDFFNFQFTGYVDILEAGNYIFKIASDDGSRLIFDSNIIADNDGTHGNITVTSDTIFLTQGAHPIEVQYFDYSGANKLTVSYTGPDLTQPFKNIPDSLLRSAKYIPGATPAKPTGLTAAAAGMERINLNWQIVPGAEVEIYRSLQQTGTYSVIGKSSSGGLADTVGLTPATTYYYKAKSVSNTGASGFSGVVSAATSADNIAPSVPAGLAISTKSHTHVALTWTASTDNVEVTAYEIYVEGALHGVSDIPAFLITDLFPSVNYSVTIRAVDASNNKSPHSAALAVTTNPSAIYYSSASGALNALTTWKQNPDGSGISPESFGENGQYFIISNRTETGLGGPWELSGTASKLVVPDGVTLTVDQRFTGRLELEGSAALNLDHVNVPELFKISPESTIRFNVPSVIPNENYGNLVLGGSGIKDFDAGSFAIAGNLDVANGVTLKGAAGNATVLTIGGNLTINGTTGITAADNRINLDFTSSTAHTLSSGGTVYLGMLTVQDGATVNISSPGEPVQVITGSLNGGGVTVKNGGVLSLNSNTLVVIDAGTINEGNESGAISVNGGNLSISTSSSTHSNVYFDAVQNRVDSLVVNASGTGMVRVRSALQIVDMIRLKNGVLNAGGFITLLSTDSKTARIAAIEAGGEIVGNITVQHYISPMGESWRELATSVTGVNVSDWQEFFPVTGSFSGASSGLGSAPSMFISNGTTMTAYPFAGTSNMVPIEKGRGYKANIALTEPFTIEVSGNPFQGTVNFSLNTGTGGGTNNGWNLLGNPYAAPISWSNEADAWTKTGIANTVAVKRNMIVNGQSVGKYVYYDPLLGQGTIESGQGFWVQARTSAASLAITERAKVEKAAQYPAPLASTNYVTISLSDGQASDETHIIFADDATRGFDNAYDALKIANEGLFNISSALDGSIDLAVNYLSNSFCSESVHLNLQDTPPGTYSLSFTGLGSLIDIGTVKLIDAFTGTSAAVSAQPVSFQITTDENSFGADRFTLIFERTALDLDGPAISAEDVCAGEEAVILIAGTQSGVAYTAVNSAGESISSPVEGGAESVSLVIADSALNVGENQVSILAGFAGCTSALLSASADFVYTAPFDISTEGEVSVCVGQSALLEASGVPDSGTYYWYDQDKVLISSTEGADFTTPVVTNEMVFYVSGVLPNGCESDLKAIHVYGDSLDVPVVMMHNDTLYTQVSGTYQWRRNGEAIEGANSAYYRPVTSGDFTVLVSNGGCVLESQLFTYVIDPDCTIDTASPVVTANHSCGDEPVIVTISSSQPGVEYFAINNDNEAISPKQTGTGETILLEVASVALDSGINEIRIRADFEGCVDRVLDSSLEVEYIPLATPQITANEDILIAAGAGSLQWKRNGEEIDGATEGSFTPNISGSYTVVSTVGSCSKESAPYEFLVTATEDPGGFSLTTYPVPATSGHLTVSLQSPDLSDVYIRILDLTGKVVFQQWFAFRELSKGVPVDRETMPFRDGIYIVIANQGTREVRKRIVIVD